MWSVSMINISLKHSLLQEYTSIYLLIILAVNRAVEDPALFDALHVYVPSLNRPKLRIVKVPSLAATPPRNLSVTGPPYDLNHSISVERPDGELALHDTTISVPLTAHTVDPTSTDSLPTFLTTNFFCSLTTITGVPIPGQKTFHQRNSIFDREIYFRTRT